MFKTQANVGELARLLGYFRFSRQCSWTFESFGMWCLVDGRMVHGVSTDRNAFVFRVKHSFLAACAEYEGHTMLRNVGHFSSSDTTSRPRKSESSRIFLLSLHTKTWDWSLFPFMAVVDVIFCQQNENGSVEAYKPYFFFFYSSDISRWQLSWPHYFYWVSCFS
jgi:hypothetical protein